jgi:threonine synthase
VERDGKALHKLWRKLDTDGEFDLSLLPRAGFASGRSTHADRIATIRALHAKYGVTIDPHTADGVKVGLEHREAGVPLICLETALPAKFAETIREALGREPARPAGFADLEQLPQRFEVIEPDPEAVKRYIAAHAS